MATYPKELTDLVKEYLTDGIITSKERQVLLKKAEKLGIDSEEFDLYLDAQQQKADQETEVTASKKRGKTCPFCGTPIPLLSDKCPSCGSHITAESTEELTAIIETLEDSLQKYKIGYDMSKNKAIMARYVRKANLFYGSNPKVKRLLEEIQIETDAEEKKAKSKALLSIRTAILVFIKNHKWYSLLIGVIIVRSIVALFALLIIFLF